MFLSASPAILSAKQTENDIMSMKPKAVCVHAVEFSHDIVNWKVQGHSYILTSLHLHAWSFSPALTAVNVRVVIHPPSLRVSEAAGSLLNTEQMRFSRSPKRGNVLDYFV